MLIVFEKFSLHNQHWVGLDQFRNFDPHLKKLKNVTYVYESPLLKEFPYDVPGVYVVSGGRQVGKTTFLKQSMLKLISDKSFLPDDVLFLTGEIIYSADELRRILNSYLEKKKAHSVVFVDEVNYIPGWDRAVKFVADSGLLERCSLVLTGSDIIIIKDAMKRFPGRRGRNPKTNFHYYPLSFLDYLILKKKLSKGALQEIIDSPYVGLMNSSVVENNIAIIYDEFKSFMITGGYLTAINDLAKEGRILNDTFATYWEWIVGDVLKHHKTENYLREVLSGILDRYNSLITWNSLQKDLSIDHHKTISDYCDMLEQMDAVYVHNALIQHKLSAAPKKAKKVYFTDPFIHHSVHIMIKEAKDPWIEYLAPLTKNEELLAPFVEAATIAHFRRNRKVFYIKNDGEIDLAYVEKQKIYPIEIKWTSQLRPKDLYHILKYHQGIIAGKVDSIFKYNENWVVPIPILLIKEMAGSLWR